MLHRRSHPALLANPNWETDDGGIHTRHRLAALGENPKRNTASRWFRASEAAGDFMGIRYGRIAPGSDVPEWLSVSHCDCDGIGGFARLLRERGAELPELPRTKNPCPDVIAPLWRLWLASHWEEACADRRDWEQPRPSGTEHAAPPAWRLFTEAETKAILAKCRRDRVTVNSFLLKHLDQAVRPEIKRPDLKIPWMIPVNLRGDITHADDTGNHVSCVEPRIAPDDPAEAIQKQILRRLNRGEHRANHLLLGLGKFLSHGAKVRYLNKDRSKPAGNIGAFSNLGVWDAEKKIEAGGSWVFCPPVVTGQLLGAGCVTFQNRLGLAIQGHSGLPSSPEIAKAWMKRWVDGI